MSPAAFEAAWGRPQRVGPVAILALASATLLAACGPTDSSAVGIVVAIEPSGSEATAFTLRTGAGEILGFVVGALELDGGAFAASHLRDHLATSQPMAVGFRVEGGTRVAHRLVDAPWFSP